MQQYLDLLQDILDNGDEKKSERTGTGTLAVFGRQLRFDLRKGFPLLTTKKMFTRGIIEELLWMISGSQNIRPLVLKDVNIWNEWPFQNYLKANKQEEDIPQYTVLWYQELDTFTQRIKSSEEFAQTWGNLGDVYGYKWRHWIGVNGKEVDQLAKVIDLLKNKPDDRRIVVTCWDPSVVDEVALPPCHLFYQFYVAKGVLSCQMYQRSVDTFLGLPFNIAQYAFLTSMVAQVVNLVPGEIILDLGDTHLYLNHLEQARLQLTRQPYKLPELVLNTGVNDIFEFKYEDFIFQNYQYHPHIKAEISV